MSVQVQSMHCYKLQALDLTAAMNEDSSSFIVQGPNRVLSG